MSADFTDVNRNFSAKRLHVALIQINCAMNLRFNHPPTKKKSNYSSEYFHGLIFVGHKIATGCLDFALGIGMYAVVKLGKN